MPKFTHEVTSTYNPSFRTAKVAGMFDVPVEDKLTKTWEVDMPFEDIGDWGVGVIVGPSGSGKTTIAKEIFGEGSYHEGFDWTHDKSLLDDFAKDLSIREITDALSHVGFSSPPAWLLPFDKLSNGQKFRAEMARVILESDGEKPVVVDEFTSVVDRTVAKVSSYAVQKYVRKSGKKFVAVGCHYDILEWLEPDWVYYVDSGTFEVTRGSLRRPEVNIRVERVHHSAWRIFKGHHYLDANINKSAHCFVAFIDDKPVAFAAVLYFMHPKVKGMWKGHRTVVLPDYQGLGIGNRLSEAVAEHYICQPGLRFTSVTSHPAMIAHRNRSPKWVMTRKPGVVPALGKNAMKSVKQSASTARMTASFEYIGDENSCKCNETDEKSS